RRVSGARSAEKESGWMSRAVRQTPFTAMLAPSVRSERTVAQRTRRRDPAVTTAPSSSMIPVNIFLQRCFYGAFGRGDRMDPKVVEANGVGAAAASDASRDGERLHASQDFWRVVEEDFVGDAGFESGPVDAAAGFDHQGKIFFFRQKFDDCTEIGPSVGV